MLKQPMIRRILDIIRASLNGEQRDYTQGNMTRAIFLLAIPMILELSLESVFAVVDIFFVSKLGQHAITTVGLTESVISLVYSVAIGLSTAATAVVARRIGEKNPDAAAHAGAQSLIIAFIATTIISILGVVFAGDILSLMGADKKVVIRRSGIYPYYVWRKPGDHVNISHQRYFSGCWRCRYGNEESLAGQFTKHHFMPHIYSFPGSSRSSHCHGYRKNGRSIISMLSFDEGQRNYPDPVGPFPL